MSGGLLLLLMLLCGWTGYVMVWDTFGEHLAREGARMVDALPILSEPVSRAFTGERPVPSVFFFITLFAHIGIPLGMGVVFWLHVKRLARPAMLPPRPLTVDRRRPADRRRGRPCPSSMAPRANPFVLAAEVPVDLFVAFWMPLTASLGGGVALLLAVAAVAVALASCPSHRAARRRGAAAVDGRRGHLHRAARSARSTVPTARSR